MTPKVEVSKIIEAELPAEAGAVAPQPGDVQNVASEMEAHAFVTIVLRGETRDWNGWKIKGDVNFNSTAFPHAVEVCGAIFTGLVNFGGCRFERAANLCSSRFTQGLSFSNARVKGPLLLDEVVIGDERLKDAETDLSSRIIARLERGCAEARPGRQGGREERIHRREQSRDRRKSLQQSIDQKPVQRIYPRHAADFTNLYVAGCVSLMGARIFGGLACNQSEIEDDVRIDGAQIEGNLTFRDANG